MSLYAFQLAQILSTILVEIGHGSQDDICAKSAIWDKISENDHSLIQYYRRTHIYQIMKDTHFIQL